MPFSVFLSRRRRFLFAFWPGGMPVSYLQYDRSQWVQLKMFTISGKPSWAWALNHWLLLYDSILGFTSRWHLLIPFNYFFQDMNQFNAFLSIIINSTEGYILPPKYLCLWCIISCFYPWECLCIPQLVLNHKVSSDDIVPHPWMFIHA